MRKRPSRWCPGVPGIFLGAVVLWLFPCLSVGMQSNSTIGSSSPPFSSTMDDRTITNNNNGNNPSDKFKILYIVTSGGKGNSGTARFERLVLSVIQETVRSLLQNPRWHVDVYLILGYDEFPLQPRLEQDLQAIHPDIQLFVWVQALPVFYGCDQWTNNLRDPIGSGRSCRNQNKVPGHSFSEAGLFAGNSQLARQHRLVVKDLLPHYDFFLAFEDDMLIHKDHVEYHLEWMAKLRVMREETKARDEQGTNDTSFIATDPEDNDDDAWKTRALQSRQLQRLRPGFLRVEVSERYTTVRVPLGNISDVDVSDAMVSQAGAMINPTRCCHRPKHLTLNPDHTSKPNMTANDLLLWETSVLGYGLRRLGDDWVGMLPGPKTPFRLSDYWSGRVLNRTISHRPRRGDPQYIAQSAGWMGSRREILEYNDLCEGGFLPPFDEYPQDGLFRNNVEFWSGGIQLWSGTCNIGRFVDLQQFDRHLLYHTSNNKQHNSLTRKRLISASVLLAQLMVVKKAAELELHRAI